MLGHFGTVGVFPFILARFFPGLRILLQPLCLFLREWPGLHAIGLDTFRAIGYVGPMAFRDKPFLFRIVAPIEQRVGLAGVGSILGLVFIDDIALGIDDLDVHRIQLARVDHSSAVATALRGSVDIERIDVMLLGNEAVQIRALIYRAALRRDDGACVEIRFTKRAIDVAGVPPHVYRPRQTGIFLYFLRQPGGLALALIQMQLQRFA
ncbi:hypothetical protein D3C85_1013990 [compost metagenome]